MRLKILIYQWLLMFNGRQALIYHNGIGAATNTAPVKLVFNDFLEWPAEQKV